jgi:hypothetical protein
LANGILKSSSTSDRVGQVARAMLDGSMNYLVGAIELEKLRHELGAYENDPDFIVFVAVKMDVQSLPDYEQLITSLQKYPEKNTDENIRESVVWAKSISLEQCKSLAARYPS